MVKDMKKMKIGMIGIFALVFSMIFSLAAVSANPSVYIVPENDTVLVGEQSYFDVYIDSDGNNIWGIDNNIDYTSSNIAVTGAEVLYDRFWNNEPLMYDDVDGHYANRVAFDDWFYGVDSDDVAYRVYFSASLLGDTEITLSYAELNDADTGEMYCTRSSCGYNLNVQGATIHVIEPIVDSDGDGIADDEDNCVFDYNPLQNDSDGDGVGDVCDNCPDVDNPAQLDTDCVICKYLDYNADLSVGNVDLVLLRDEVGLTNCTPENSWCNWYDVTHNGYVSGNDMLKLREMFGCDVGGFQGILLLVASEWVDSDGDNVTDDIDNCVNLSNPDQEDYDGDGMGDACQYEGVVCDDWDGGNYPDIWGHISGICYDCTTPTFGSNSDHCVNDYQIREMYCVNEFGWSRTIRDCEFGCINGVCIDPTSDINYTSECWENDTSDAGEEFLAGAVYYKGHPLKYAYDECLSETLLEEHFCVDDHTRSYRRVECEYGCLNGACLFDLVVPETLNESNISLSTEIVPADSSSTSHYVGGGSSSGSSSSSSSSSSSVTSFEELDGSDYVDNNNDAELVELTSDNAGIDGEGQNSLENSNNKNLIDLIIEIIRKIFVRQ